MANKDDIYFVNHFYNNSYVTSCFIKDQLKLLFPFALSVIVLVSRPIYLKLPSTRILRLTKIL